MSLCAKPKGEVAESKNIEHKSLRLGKRLEQTMVKGLEDAPLNKLSTFWDQLGFPPLLY